MIKKIFDGFGLAVSMLSVVPFFKVHHFYKGINGYSVMFYPLVGALLGGLLYGFYMLCTLVFPQTHSVVLVFGAWVVLTGALHLDGLSDTIDGLFVAKEKALDVMKDSHVGGMGMIFSGVFLLLKLSSLLALSDMFYIIPVMMLSRFGAVIALYHFPYVHKNGMGALAKEELTPLHYALAFGSVLLLSIVLHVSTLFLLTYGVIYLLAQAFIRRYGGLSGDMYGFMIEVSELLLLNAVIAGLV